jgi:hypothetical protein
MVESKGTALVRTHSRRRFAVKQAAHVSQADCQKEACAAQGRAPVPLSASKRAQTLTSFQPERSQKFATRPQFLSRLSEDDPPTLHHVDAICHAQRPSHVLLDE